MKNSRLEYRAHYLLVDCNHADGHDMSDACRELAVECLARQTNRVLVQALGCDPEAHFPLRNAFTTMVLAGIPSGFRLALVTDVPRVRALFGNLQQDLQLLNIHVRAFLQESEAADWLQQAVATRPAQAQPASRKQA